MKPQSEWLLLLMSCALQLDLTVSFVNSGRALRHAFFRQHQLPSAITLLQSGRGVANDYTWQEEAFEIEVSVQVPANTRAKDISFKATSRSIELKLLAQNNDTETLLLDSARQLRGRVNLDGTYWVIGDIDNRNKTHRTVTVTIEKLLQTPQDDFEVVDYDWKGLYRDDTDEVSVRDYDKPEALDVRKYAASMGVDIDNINMSMVDKTMFSSNLNLTRSTLDEITKSGYAQEVTRQADGTEFTVSEDGQAERIPSMQETMGSEKPKIPLIDTDSPWHSAVPVHRDPETNQTFIQETRNFTQAAFAQDAALQRQEKEQQLAGKTAVIAAKDPIDTMTVARLKEVLKSQGLKTSGTKQELRDRLRAQVNALLQGKQN